MREAQVEAVFAPLAEALEPVLLVTRLRDGRHIPDGCPWLRTHWFFPSQCAEGWSGEGHTVEGTHAASLQHAAHRACVCLHDKRHDFVLGDAASVVTAVSATSAYRSRLFLRNIYPT